jgi:predicted nucleotidyltransferase
MMDRARVIAKLKSVEPELRAHGVGALYLFGSYARNEARENSDVDVFVDPGTQDFFGLEHFVGAYEVIRRAVPGRDIGYGTRNGLSKYIRDAVEREAIQVF